PPTLAPPVAVATVATGGGATPPEPNTAAGCPPPAADTTGMPGVESSLLEQPHASTARSVARPTTDNPVAELCLSIRDSLSDAASLRFRYRLLCGRIRVPNLQHATISRIPDPGISIFIRGDHLRARDRLHGT